MGSLREDLHQDQPNPVPFGTRHKQHCQGKRETALVACLASGRLCMAHMFTQDVETGADAECICRQCSSPFHEHPRSDDLGPRLDQKAPFAYMARLVARQNLQNSGTSSQQQRPRCRLRRLRSGRRRVRAYMHSQPSTSKNVNAWLTLNTATERLRAR